MGRSQTISDLSEEEERAMIAEFETSPEAFRGELTPELRREIEAAARAKLDASREKISLRIPRTDLAKLKERAAKEGMPYQTLINSILHKYVAG